MNASSPHTIGYFDQAAGAWSDKYLAKGHFRTRLETVLGWLAAENPNSTFQPTTQQILDFGCGSGVFIDALVERGYHVTGVDASPGMIEASRSFLAQRQPDKGDHYQLEVVDGQTFEGNYLRQVYNGVCCLGVLEYIGNYPLLLEKLTQAVAPGGFLIVSVPNRQSLLRGIETWVHGHPGLFEALGLFPHLTGPDSYLNFQKHQFTLDGLSRELAALGFTREKGRFHVAPGLLQPMEHLPAVGMTVIALYRKGQI